MTLDSKILGSNFIQIESKKLNFEKNFEVTGPADFGEKRFYDLKTSTYNTVNTVNVERYWTSSFDKASYKPNPSVT